MNHAIRVHFENTVQVAESTALRQIAKTKSESEQRR